MPDISISAGAVEKIKRLQLLLRKKMDAGGLPEFCKASGLSTRWCYSIVKWDESQFFDPGLFRVYHCLELLDDIAP